MIERDNPEDHAVRGSPPTSNMPLALLLIGACVAVSACDSLLEVELPGQVTAAALENPANAPVLVGGVIADFECAFDTYVVSAGMFSDELEHVGFSRTFNPIDARGTGDTHNAGSCGSAGTSYRPLQVARFQAEDVYDRISGFEGIENQDELLAPVAAFGGYTYTLLGEGWCDGSVPVTDRGPPLSRDELQSLAVERFTTAISHARAAGNADVEHMARLGRARARLNLGDEAGALADAQAIPEDFRFVVTRDRASGRRENYLADLNVLGSTVGVEPAFRGLEIEGEPDPRVDVYDSGRVGEDGQNPVWAQRKYSELESDLTLASWEEAQLIIAEVEGGQAAVDAINRLRDEVELAHFQSTDESEILAQVLEERRRELFLESHRINDVYRHDLDYLQGPATVKGIGFGDFKCLPPQRIEMENNPNM